MVVAEEVASGLRLVTRPTSTVTCASSRDRPGQNRLSMPALEALAMVAISSRLQPRRSRTRSSFDSRTLLERRLRCRAQARGWEAGSCTQQRAEFLMHFGLDAATMSRR